MKKYIFGLFLAVMIVPQAASAFSVTDSKVTKFSDRLAVFQIDYELGYGKYGMENPIGAVRGSSKGLFVDYSIRSGDGEVVGLGESSALVVGGGYLSNGAYRLAPGVSDSYSLYVIWAVPEGETIHDYYLQVDRLPFNLIDDDGEYSNGLSTGELKGFTAKRTVIKLGE